MAEGDDGTPSTTSPRRRRLSGDQSDRRTFLAPAPGTLLSDRYLLEAELGRGGFGIVFRAKDQELGISVAVKVLPPQLAYDERAIQDLKREAVVAMRLRHPGIATLYNFAYSEDVKYLVMELLDGCTLDERVAELERLPLEQVLALARELAVALDYAHGEGVVHRDLKPSNIFLQRKGDREQARLMDFGIARQMQDSLQRASQREASGTLLYMSPEQLEGKDVDARADVYSFAATLYECLCGHPPFHQGSVSYQIANVEPEPIPGLPDHVNAALLAGLAKAPAARPASASLLVRALEATPAPAVNPNVPSAAPPAGTWVEPRPSAAPASAPAAAPAPPAPPAPAPTPAPAVPAPHPAKPPTPPPRQGGGCGSQVAGCLGTSLLLVAVAGAGVLGVLWVGERLFPDEPRPPTTRPWTPPTPPPSRGPYRYDPPLVRPTPVVYPWPDGTPTPDEPTYATPRPTRPPTRQPTTRPTSRPTAAPTAAPRVAAVALNVHVAATKAEEIHMKGVTVVFEPRTGGTPRTCSLTFQQRKGSPQRYYHGGVGIKPGTYDVQIIAEVTFLGMPRKPFVYRPEPLVVDGSAVHMNQEYTVTVPDTGPPGP